MADPPLPDHSEGEHHTPVIKSPLSRSLYLRLVTWCATGVWWAGVDWCTKRPFLTRVTAHLSVVALALTAIFLGSAGIPEPRIAVGGPLNADVVPFRDIGLLPDSEGEPPLVLPVPSSSLRASATDTVTRLPVPHTTIPDRPRPQVITYTVQEGDTVFDIAAWFGLAPETIVHGNREAIKGAPWLIRPGLELLIPPVDGVLHTVRDGETVADIAALYEAELAVLYNEWNELEEGEQPSEGLILVVPAGQGEEVEWEPPPPPPPARSTYIAASPSPSSSGAFGGGSLTGPDAYGWFIYPTGGSRISGWYFRDRRNPTHIGLDYACRMGDPIYAADNGVVTIAGWHGGYGIVVEVNHSNGYITRYAHFNDIIVGYGQPVYQGQVLGYCGNTGWSTGAHLHFEIRLNGVPQNPQNYLP